MNAHVISIYILQVYTPGSKIIWVRYTVDYSQMFRYVKLSLFYFYMCQSVTMSLLTRKETEKFRPQIMHSIKCL